MYLVHTAMQRPEVWLLRMLDSLLQQTLETKTAKVESKQNKIKRSHCQWVSTMNIRLGCDSSDFKATSIGFFILYLAGSPLSFALSYIILIHLPPVTILISRVHFCSLNNPFYKVNQIPIKLPLKEHRNPQ